MFGFMKKDREDKERKKKDKRQRVKDKVTLSLEELKRLDESRKSLSGKAKKKRDEKLPSGITADYMDQFRSQLGLSLDKETTSDASSSNNFKLLREHYEALASGTSVHSDSTSEGTISSLSPIRSGSQSTKTTSELLMGYESHKQKYSKGWAESEQHYENLMNRSFVDSPGGSYGSPYPQESPGGSYGSPSHSGDVADRSQDSRNLELRSPFDSFDYKPMEIRSSSVSGAESSGWSQMKVFDADLELPTVLSKGEVPARQLTIYRSTSGDFGFSLRRAIVTEYKDNHSCVRKTIVLAEPGVMGRANQTGLLPGDRLIEVNGVPVEELSRDEIIQLIKGSGEFVSVVVKPVPELSELSSRQMDDGTMLVLDKKNIMEGTLKRSGNKKREIIAKSEQQIEARQEWLNSEKVWLVHRGGFCSAFLQSTEASKPTAEGKVLLAIEHSQDILEADENDVEKANPPTLDLSEDLSKLKYLNESSILHCLRQRYGSSLIHTYAGQSMIIINPTVPIAIYSEKVIQMFRGCHHEDMPPHIYSVAQSAYHDMISSRKDQSIIFSGRSGSGKTTNFRHVLHYFALASASPSPVLTVERLNAISTLVEAFGNGRTLLNTNATRYTQTFTLNFDTTGQILSASVQVTMPEMMRVVRRPDGEPNYHIFYQLLSGADEDLRDFLELTSLGDPNFLMTPLQRMEDRQKAGTAWARICAAFDVMRTTKDEQKAIWRVLAAIYHLGTSGKVKVSSTGSFSFENTANVQKAAKLLGTSIEELSKVMFTSSKRASMSPDSPTDVESATDALEGLVCGLYYETFNAVVALINRCIFSGGLSKNSIVVVDAPGSQNPASVGRSTGAGLGDLCHNYVQERLQMLFHDTTFVSQTNRYVQENIDCRETFGELGAPAPLLSLLDQKGNTSNVQTSVQTEDERTKGILWMIDEESLYSGSSDQALVEKIFQAYSGKEFSKLISRGKNPEQFYLNHFQGTNTVLYNAKGWLNASRENQVLKRAVAVLQESNCENISRLYVFSRGPVSNSVNNTLGGVDGTHSLHRTASVRRCLTTASNALLTRSVCLQVKLSTDSLIERLRRTKLRFVHCMLPQHNSGLCDLRNYNANDNIDDNFLINVPLLRSQLRGAQILDSLRIQKQGFPEHLFHDEFVRQFAVLSDRKFKRVHTTNFLDAMKDILERIDLDSSSYRIGNSQIFFRIGTLARLEEQRETVLSDVITSLQAMCRGYLARRRLQKKKVQETAIRCIQKNVRKFMGVRNWPWWRLLVRITPLLDVHRTELDLKNTREELTSLTTRFTSLEKEKNDLVHQKEKLESRLYEMTVDLSEEQNASQLISERLQTEQNERLKLQKEVVRLQDDLRKMTNMNGDHDAISRDLEILRSNNLNGDISEEGMDSGLYKKKYEWSQKEVELLKKQVMQLRQDGEDQFLLLKKQLEKKLLDAEQEAEEQRQVVAQLKKKSQKVTSEMNDIKILLEDQTSRNNLLEKKQRRFDQEMQTVQDEARKEKLQKETAQRDRDQTLAAKYTLDQDILTLKLENELKDERIAALKAELDELHSSGNLEEETIMFKKIKNELEMKNKDQEEELDEMAGQVQMLEAAKIRLEMSIEQIRKENKLESAQRDQELEEFRMSSQKKLRNLENQLEMQYEERSQLLREKHELERKLSDAQDKAMAQHDDDHIHRLKRDLRKTKVLLRDTQTQLERAQSEGSSKLLIRQLKTQLEDAEFARTAALKGKQIAEADVREIQSFLEESTRSKKDAEDRAIKIAKEKAEIYSQMEESEEELSELMKKYKTAVHQHSQDQIILSEQTQQIAELEHEKQILQDKMLELSSKVEVLEGESASIHTQRRLQMKVKEVESKLELEHTARHRFESQISRLKDQLDRETSESEASRNRESKLLDESKKLNRLLRETREDLSCAHQKNTESFSRKQEVEKQLELAESEIITLKSDLKLAFKRIEDLQQALQGDISDSESDGLDTGSDSDLSLSSYVSASANYRRSQSTGVSTGVSNSPSIERQITSKDETTTISVLEDPSAGENQPSDSFA